MGNLLSTLLICAPLLTQGLAKEMKVGSDLLKYIPNGAALTNVKIPTFNENGTPSSLFSAEQVKVVDKDSGQIDVIGVEVEVMKEERSTFLHFKKARYDRNKSLITTDEIIQLSRSNLSIEGKGAYFDLVTQELFIKGPSKSTYVDHDLAANLSQYLPLLVAAPPVPKVVLSGAEKERLVKLASTLKIPEVTLSEQKKAELKAAQEKAANTKEVLAAQAAKEAEKSSEIGSLAAMSDKNLKKFINKAQGELPETQVTANPKPSDEVPPMALVITNEGGIYLDAENNVLVYLKNVVVENTDLKLTCSKDLKVFLEPKNKDEKKPAKDAGALGSMGSLTLKELLASGNVVIEYKKTKGKQPIVAKGATALYQMGSEEVLIKGGYPNISQGPNRSEALEEDMWVKLSRTGAVWSKGKQRQIYVPEK